MPVFRRDFVLPFSGCREKRGIAELADATSSGVL